MSTPMFDAGAEPGALGLHLREARLEVLLLHLEVGDAVAQQSADAVVALEHGDGVAGAGELLRGGEAGGAGADDGDGLAGEALRRMRAAPSRSAKAWSMIETSTCLIVTAGWLMPSTHDALARRRAQPAGELREVVGRVQALDRLRGPRRARSRSFHSGIRLPSGQPWWQNGMPQSMQRPAWRRSVAGVARLVDLFPVHEAHGDGAPRRKLALACLQEALRVSHRSPP